MARMARLVVPGLPHHVTQRGVRSIDVFADDDDRRLYLELMREQGERFGVRFLAWCLMSNHVHLVCAPEGEQSLARGIGEAHKRYTRSKNFRAGARGYLFQGRFGSCVLDEKHLMAAARYVDLNPVAARICATPEAYEWSSARFHLDGRRRDPLVLDQDRDLSGLVDDWTTFLQDGIDEIAARRLERHLGSGRPCGSDGFVEMLEKRTGRELRPRKRGWRTGRARK
jgi:putative transposase